MRRRGSILIRSEDHLGDPLGVIFMLEADQIGDSVIEKLRDYLGQHIEVIKAVVSRDKIEVEVEYEELREESDRLVEAARGLQSKQLFRSAEATLDEALKLAPLNHGALMALAEVLQDAKKFPEAIAVIIRARETAEGDTAQVLAMLGACCLKVERTAAAIIYCERALALDPRNFSARRSLLAMGRRPNLIPSRREQEETIAARRKPQVKR